MEEKVLPLTYYPDPLLRQKAAPVDLKKLPDFQQLLLAMERAMDANDGVGLAAPQIGRGVRVAIVRMEDEILPLINPKILFKSFKKDVMEEGCLSIPKVYGPVKRSTKIIVSTLTPEGKRMTVTVKGFLARVIQHEIDHLNGILFIDKAASITSGAGLLKKYQAKK